MAKMKTEEQYIIDLGVKNPDVELVGHYMGDHVKIPHRCKIHNIIWNIDPNHALRGHGCCECAQERKIKKRIKQTEKYVSELAIKNPNIKLKGEYKGTNRPTLHYCETHKIDFEIKPSDALYGKGCKYCKGDKLRRAFLKSTEQYVEELAIKNSTIKLVGEYLGTDTSTAHYCTIHDVLWNIKPSNALHGEGCWKCRGEKISNKLRKPEDVYIEELSQINPSIKLYGEYVNNKTPAQHYCEKHQLIFSISPECALRGYGCRQCASEKLSAALTKSEKQYIIDLQQKHNGTIMLLGSYVNTYTNTLHKCMVCGCEWSPKPRNVLFGYGCPVCNESKGEKQVSMYLIQHNIEYVPQKCFDDCCDIRRLPFDFYLPTYNICIEYQGKQHYEPIDFFGGEAGFVYTQCHDEIKFQYCKDNKIQLFYIPYWEDVNKYLDKNLLI